jgi:hypothetical protein
MNSKIAVRAAVLVGHEWRWMRSFLRVAKKLSATEFVVAVALRSHRDCDPGLAAALPEHERHELGAVVGVVHEAGTRSSAGDGHLERVDDEL